MDFQLTEEQKIFKKTVHDFADSFIAPMVDVWEKGGPSSSGRDEFLSAYRELGLLGITLPEKYGGGGMPAIFAILAMEELARVTTRASGLVIREQLWADSGRGACSARKNKNNDSSRPVPEGRSLCPWP